jgi:hypothetical protein
MHTRRGSIVSLDNQTVESQLLLPIAGDAGVPEGRSVWLLSASKNDASVLRQSTAGDQKGRHAFMLLDLENGDEAVRPDDIILLKTADRGGLDVFADLSSIGAGEACRLAGRLVASFREAPDRSVSRKSIDLGFVRFASNTRRRDPQGWSRNEIESAIDFLLLREMTKSVRLTERMCVELLDHPRLSPASPLRPIAQRMRADVLQRSIASDDDRRLALRLYREAASGFAAAGIVGQSETSRIRANLIRWPRQLEMWPREDRNQQTTASPIGMHMRRFTGMRLPLVSFGFGGTASRGPLRHVCVGTVRLELTMIASWIAGDSGHSAEVSMTVQEPVSLNGARSVEFVVDTELATLSGMAGRIGRRGPRDRYRFIPRSSTCEIHPRFAEAAHGKPATFVVRPLLDRRHVIRLHVLTGNTPPTSIDFLLPL